MAEAILGLLAVIARLFFWEFIKELAVKFADRIASVRAKRKKKMEGCDGK